MHADPRGSGRGWPDRLILMMAAPLGGLRRGRWVDHGNGERGERDGREEEEKRQEGEDAHGRALQSYVSLGESLARLRVAATG